MAAGMNGRTAITRRHFLSSSSTTAGALFLAGGEPAIAGHHPSTHLLGRAPAARRDVSFASTGAELHAWLYEPDVAPPWPLVVMGHGYSATRQMSADKYAEAFCSVGTAVLLFDHRGFGASGGEPRRQINTWIQARGYLDAVRFARTNGSIDGTRIAVWGDSLSGGVALVVAAIDTGIAALLIQTPAIGRTLPPADPDGSLFRTLRETVLSGAVEPTTPGEIDGPMPVVSDDPIRRPSALLPLSAYRWFIEYGGRFGSGWLNDVTRARVNTPVAWHPGLAAPYVSCPSLFVVSPQDEMPGAVPAVSRDALDRTRGPKEWVDIDGGHFGLLFVPSAEFDNASSAQARFLSEHLIARR